MEKAPVKLLAGFTSIAGLILLLAVTVNVSQQSQSLTSRAGINSPGVNVKMIFNPDTFNSNETIVVGFSKESCCKVLSHEYVSDGVIFDNEIDLGWSTYQADGFANHLSTAEKEPGAPAGSTGTRMVFNEPVKRVGFYIQSGSPFDRDSFRISKSITYKAYDEENKLIFHEVTDTCLSEASTCQAKFFGIESDTKVIKSVEAIMNDQYSWSIDDLMFEI